MWRLVVLSRIPAFMGINKANVSLLWYCRVSVDKMQGLAVAFVMCLYVCCCVPECGGRCWIKIRALLVLPGHCPAGPGCGMNIRNLALLVSI